jgi:hypothetical protein
LGIPSEIGTSSKRGTAEFGRSKKREVIRENMSEGNIFSGAELAGKAIG